jgi:hypothetical protein
MKNCAIRNDVHSPCRIILALSYRASTHEYTLRRTAACNRGVGVYVDQTRFERATFSLQKRRSTIGATGPNGSLLVVRVQPDKTKEANHDPPVHRLLHGRIIRFHDTARNYLFALHRNPKTPTRGPINPCPVVRTSQVAN